MSDATDGNKNAVSPRASQRELKKRAKADKKVKKKSKEAMKSEKFTNPAYGESDSEENEVVIFANPMTEGSEPTKLSRQASQVGGKAVKGGADAAKAALGGAVLAKDAVAASPRFFAEAIEGLVDDREDPVGPEQMLDLLATFEACDQDGSGVIDLDEFYLAMRTIGCFASREELKQIIATEKAEIAAEKESRGKIAPWVINAISLWQIKKHRLAEAQAGADELKFEDFVHLFATGAMDNFFDISWMEGCLKMRVLRMGFNTADVDNSGLLSGDEFKLVCNSLHSGKLTDIEKHTVWSAINPDKLEELNFTQFLEGMGNIFGNERLLRKFNIMSPNLLMGLVLDTPVSAQEEKRVMDNLSLPEKFGVEALTKFEREWTAEEKAALFERHKAKKMHEVTPQQRSELNALHRWGIFTGFMIGVLTCTVLSFYEAWLTYAGGCDGMTKAELLCKDGNQSLSCDPTFIISEENSKKHHWEYPKGQFLGNMGTCKSECVGYRARYNKPDAECTHFCMDGTESPEEIVCDDDVIVSFWIKLIVAIIIQASLEIGLLYYYAIKYSVTVADCLALRLIPLNRDRAFVCAALVRSALELPNPDTPVLGVNPKKEGSEAQSGCETAFWTLIYKAKIGMTSVIMKLIMRRFLSRGGARTVLPFMAIPATAIWDAFFAHLAIGEARLRGIGFSAAVEVFDEIVDPILLADAKDQETDQRAIYEGCVRAVAAVIKENRRFYPSKEVLLRHAVTHVGLLTEAIVTPDDMKFDDRDEFLASLPKLSKEGQLAVMEVLCLAALLDG
jgi:Ca2+-binding EF-hand superfamily protein